MWRVILSLKQIEVQRHSGPWELLRSPSSCFEIGSANAVQTAALQMKMLSAILPELESYHSLFNSLFYKINLKVRNE